MKVLMLSGVFAKENEQEVVRHARAAVEFSANVFQLKLIEGFRGLECDFSVISAPFVGAWPTASDIVHFRDFEQEQTLCRYVSFNNIWGVRNFSRAHSLKKAVQPFIQDEDPQKLILVYCPHTPFIEAAVYAKRKDPRIRICLYVPDLPQYMNLNANRSWFYDLAKTYDIAVMTRLMKQVDSFVLLTEQMKDCLPVGDKPCRIIEGIVTGQELETAPIPKENDGLIRVVYTGKLNEKFGVRQLVDAFCLLEDPAYRLVLCGRGDCESYIEEKARQDSRILYQGQVTAREAKAWMARADVLVNPRKNDEEYTKYSFPSKNVEYLLTGNPVVGYLLDGMPQVYREFMTIVPDDRTESLARAIDCAAQSSHRQSNLSFQHYARERLAARKVVQEVLRMFGMLLGVTR
jgi:glycosyltransferase involved in cell wall biosynthesis